MYIIFIIIIIIIIIDIIIIIIINIIIIIIINIIINEEFLLRTHLRSLVVTKYYRVRRN